MNSNAEFFAAARGLIDGWCNRRSLRPLARLLPAYTAFNGLTHSWGDLLDALKNVRAYCRDELSDSELATLSDLIRAAEKAIWPAS